MLVSPPISQTLLERQQNLDNHSRDCRDRCMVRPDTVFDSPEIIMSTGPCQMEMQGAIKKIC